MPTLAYYNENDPFAAEWLRQLIDAGMIADGFVDERSIADVESADLEGFSQHHFFAGIGIWSYALRQAGWPDDQAVWTGSCPCQPFSAAGQRNGFHDPRHLWPEWFRLIRECRPSIIFGEQVASAAGKWIRTNEDLYQVLGRKACFDVLLQSQGLLQKRVSGLRESTAQSKETCQLCGRTYSGTRKNFDGSGAVSSKQDEPAVQFESRRYSGTNLDRILRTDGNRVRLDDAEGVELAVAAPSSSTGRIHDGEHEGRHLCPECYVSQLGADDDSANSESFAESYEACIQRLVEETGRGFEEESSRSWLSLVQFDLERSGYTFGASVVTAAGVGAPHIRQRLYFVAESMRESGKWRTGSVFGKEAKVGSKWFQDGNFADRLAVGGEDSGMAHSSESRRPPAREHGSGPSLSSTRLAEHGGMGHPDSARPQGRGVSGAVEGRDGEGGLAAGASSSDDRELAHSNGRQSCNGDLQRSGEYGLGEEDGVVSSGMELSQSLSGQNGATEGERPRRFAGASYWSNCDWLPCIDGKSRPVEPGAFPLVDGYPNRVGTLRGYGNALCAPQAQAFIEAYLSASNS